MHRERERERRERNERERERNEGPDMDVRLTTENNPLFRWVVLFSSSILDVVQNGRMSHKAQVDFVPTHSCPVLLARDVSSLLSRLEM